MKLTLPTKQLLAALATVKGIAKPSTTHPILSNVCISATADDTITLLGMDLEKQLTITMPAKVKEVGRTTLSCAKLHDSLAKARGADCVIETNDAHQSTIRVGNAVTKLLGLPPEDMPQPIELIKGTVVYISASMLNSFLGKSLVHSSTDKSNGILQSVTALSRDGKLNFQATNRKRAIMCNTEIDFTADDLFIIPKESVPMMVSLASEGEIELKFCEGAMFVKTDNCSFATKLIEGRMPDFKSAFPDVRPIEIMANREELIGVIEYAEVQTTEAAYRVSIGCDGSKIVAKGCGSLVDNKEEGFMDMNQDSMPVMKGSSKIEFNINPLYFRDALKCMSNDEVKLEMVDHRMPVVIQEPGIICMIVPMVG